jgi:hypothetical protein
MATREEVIGWINDALDTEEGQEDTLRDVLDWLTQQQKGAIMKYVIGDKIIVKVSRSGCPINQEMEVVLLNGQNMTVKNPIGQQWTCYCSGSNQDTIIFVDRKKQSEAYTEQIAALTKQIDQLEMEQDILDNYDSEEEYTAHKISQILTNRDNPKAIEEVLRTMKATHYL